MVCCSVSSQLLWVLALLTFQLPNALSKAVLFNAHMFVTRISISAFTICRLSSIPELTQCTLNTPDSCVSTPVASVVS